MNQYLIAAMLSFIAGLVYAGRTIVLPEHTKAQASKIEQIKHVENQERAKVAALLKKLGE